MPAPAPGSRIAVGGRLPGTYGCLVRSTNPGDGSLFMLTAGHVLLSERSRRGDTVFHVDDSGRRTPVAELWAWVDPESGRAGANQVDVAIARLNDPAGASPRIPGIGFPLPGVPVPLRREDRVRIVGGISAFQVGFVADPDYPAMLTPDLPDGRPDRPVTYEHLVLCTRFTAVGDSGSAVINQQGQIVGIHVGGTGTGSFFCRIAEALHLLDIEIVT